MTLNRAENRASPRGELRDLREPHPYAPWRVLQKSRVSAGMRRQNVTPRRGVNANGDERVKERGTTVPVRSVTDGGDVGKWF